MLVAFVAFPYDPEPLEGYRDVFRKLERVLPVRFDIADEHINSDMIISKIKAQITGSNIALFDITGWNPPPLYSFLRQPLAG